MSVDVNKNAKIIWDYMLMHTPLEKADAIFVLCSHDTRVADRAAELFNGGYAPLVIVSGGAGKLTQDIFDKPEAEVFKDILVSSGVPKDKIIVEPNASNTGENVRFTYALLQELGIILRSFILVQKPYMERRTYATFKKQWPDETTKITVNSPVMSYEEYMNGSSIDKDFVIILWSVTYNVFANTRNLAIKSSRTYRMRFGMLTKHSLSLGMINT